jgi:hypothetical protein
VQSIYTRLKPFLLILLCILVLLGISAVPQNIFIGNLQLKKPNLFSDISSKVKQKTIAHNTKLVTTEAIADKVSVLVQNPDSLAIIDFVHDTINNMSKFYNALTHLKKTKKKVRIAYFGDSMIEGDLITQDLRTYFQNKFGGNGVGMLPLTSITAGFRQTVIHKFSERWETYSFVDSFRKNKILGVMGYSFVPYYNADSTKIKESDWAEYTATHNKHLNNFENSYLFYGNSSGNNYVFTKDKKLKLNGTELVNVDTILYHQNSKRFKLRFNCKSAQTIYGVSIESDSGVIVDNYAFRGNSGIALGKVAKNVYEGFDKLLKYDLIILHYGLNVATEKSNDYSWYKKSMTKTIAKLKKCFPNAAFLLVSVSDKSYKVDELFETIPGIPILVDNQKQMAQENNIAFWNLYGNMGGYNSMVGWVEADTNLANKDYTHLNYRGANKVSRMLYNSLINGYNQFKSSTSSTIETNIITSIKPKN